MQINRWHVQCVLKYENTGENPKPDRCSTSCLFIRLCRKMLILLPWWWNVSCFSIHVLHSSLPAENKRSICRVLEWFMKLYILSQYGSWLTSRLNRKYKSLSDFCLLSYFHLALQTSLFRCSFLFLFIIPLFSGVKSVLRERKRTEVNQTCEGPLGESLVSVFLSLYVRESPLGTDTEGRISQGLPVFLLFSFLSRPVHSHHNCRFLV